MINAWMNWLKDLRKNLVLYVQRQNIVLRWKMGLTSVESVTLERLRGTLQEQNSNDTMK